MKRQLEQLKEFHQAFDHHTPDHPTLDGYPFEFRADLVAEEAIEFVHACGFSFWADGAGRRSLMRTHDPDWVSMVDGLCDLLYVTLGSFVSMGIDPTPFFDEVHRSNMSKKGGGKNSIGKSLKPEGWRPPEIERLLMELTGVPVETMLKKLGRHYGDPKREP